MNEKALAHCGVVAPKTNKIIQDSLLSKFYRRSLLEVKRSGREVHHSHSSSAEVKNEWSYTSPPFMTSCGGLL